jgi:hypothetical protein
VRPYLKKTHHKNVLVEWLKVKALSSNPSTAKKEKKKVLYVFMLTVEIRTNIKSFIISKRSVSLLVLFPLQTETQFNPGRLQPE